MKSVVKYFHYIIILLLIFVLIIQRNYYKDEIRKLQTHLLINKSNHFQTNDRIDEMKRGIELLEKENNELKYHNEELELLLEENGIDY